MGELSGISQITLPVCSSSARIILSEVPMKMRPPAVTTGPPLGAVRLTQTNLPFDSAGIQIVSSHGSPRRSDGRYPGAGGHEAEAALVTIGAGLGSWDEFQDAGQIFRHNVKSSVCWIDSSTAPIRASVVTWHLHSIADAGRSEEAFVASALDLIFDAGTFGGVGDKGTQIIGSKCSGERRAAASPEMVE